MNYLLKYAQKEIDQLTVLMDKVDRELEDAPEGTLAVYKRKSSSEYYQRLPNTPDKKNQRIYIPRGNLDLARELAQKEYNLKLKKLLKEMYDLLYQLLQKFPEATIEDVFDSMEEERKKLVTPVILPDDLYIEQWLNIPYEGRKFKSDDCSSFYLSNGVRVRSKSEVIIGDALLRAGIPFKYECPLELDGRTLYPDFKILDIRIRRHIYLEHFGMLDDPEYLEKVLRKIEFYELNGIHLGQQLLVTFESSKHPLDTRVVNKIINDRLLGN